MSLLLKWKIARTWSKQSVIRHLQIYGLTLALRGHNATRGLYRTPCGELAVVVRLEYGNIG